MTKYQRYVYYIYNYERGEKRGNIGFLRVELYKNNCKMTIRVRTPSQNKPLSVYFYRHNRQQMPCYLAGTFPVNNGMLNITLTYDRNDIAKRQLSLSDISGVILFANREKYYATAWDDQKILIDEMVIIDKEEENVAIHGNTPDEDEKSLLTSPDENVISHISTPDEDEKNFSTSSDENVASHISTPEEDEKNILPSPDENELPSFPELTENKDETSVSDRLETGSIEVQSLPDDEYYNFARKLLSTYPKMYPFESDEILDCVRIELQDLHEFPISYWGMAHNSFLMQGYYSYLHLIFALLQKPDGSASYIIGIPGICHVKQNYLAGLFGFQKFIPLKQTTDINGEFGYWICEVSKIIA